MERLRKPFEGVGNIVRFNWPYYAFSFGVLLAVIIAGYYVTGIAGWVTVIFGSLAFGAIAVSLLVSWYVYDLSGLYSLDWLAHVPGLDRDSYLVNIHAGFDETSALIQGRYPEAQLSVFDFYDPDKHTEASIKKARKAYPAYPLTQRINTDHLPLADNTANAIFTILAAHEIRNARERIVLFKELVRALKQDGHIVVTEHLRDTANFLAYNIGFFHFHSRHAWRFTFKSAGLVVQKQIKISPFITVFILGKYGTQS